MEKFGGFADRSVKQNFSSEIVCVIGFDHTRLLSNHEYFPANYSLVLHTMKLFHLERFAIYGISLTPLVAYVPVHNEETMTSHKLRHK